MPSRRQALVLKYVARASVAVPFVIALGFALAALTVMLVQRFGHVTAYWLMAGGLAAIGVIAASVVSVKEHEEEVAEQKAEKPIPQRWRATPRAGHGAGAPRVAGRLFTMPGGAAGALKVARVLGRNFPLVLLLVLIGALFWPTESQDAKVSAEDAEDGPAEHTSAEPRPNGFRPADTFHRRHERGSSPSQLDSSGICRRTSGIPARSLSRRFGCCRCPIFQIAPTANASPAAIARVV